MGGYVCMVYPPYKQRNNIANGDISELQKEGEVNSKDLGIDGLLAIYQKGLINTEKLI